MVWFAVAAVTEQLTARTDVPLATLMYELPLLSTIPEPNTPVLYAADDANAPPVMVPVLTSSNVPETLKVPSAPTFPSDESVVHPPVPTNGFPVLSRMRIPTAVTPVV